VNRVLKFAMLRQEYLVDRRKHEMRLPSKTTDGETDADCRCSACLQEREGE
jgi:hypothetical protein